MRCAVRHGAAYLVSLHATPSLCAELQSGPRGSVCSQRPGIVRCVLEVSTVPARLAAGPCSYALAERPLSSLGIAAPNSFWAELNITVPIPGLLSQFDWGWSWGWPFSWPWCPPSSGGTAVVPSTAGVNCTEFWICYNATKACTCTSYAYIERLPLPLTVCVDIGRINRLVVHDHSYAEGA